MSIKRTRAARGRQYHRSHGGQVVRVGRQPPRGTIRWAPLALSPGLWLRGRYGGLRTSSSLLNVSPHYSTLAGSLGSRSAIPPVSSCTRSGIGRSHDIRSGNDLPALASRQSLLNDSAMVRPYLESVDPVVGNRMATEPKNQRLTEKHRQVLEVLAIALHGREVNALLALGFKLETVADLIRSELATVRIESAQKHRAASKAEVAVIKITDDGWRLLEGLSLRRRSPRPSEDE
jgi:hypothetical protein